MKYYILKGSLWCEVDSFEYVFSDERKKSVDVDYTHYEYKLNTHGCNIARTFLLKKFLTYNFYWLGKELK